MQIDRDNKTRRAGRRTPRLLICATLAALAIGATAACTKTQPTVAPTPVAEIPPPAPAPLPTPVIAPAAPPRAPEPLPVAEPIPTPPEPVREAVITSNALDDLNRSAPLKPVFFALDSSELSREAQTILEETSASLKRNATWIVTIEGHCDERGAAEYNLALGERRAVAARAYLISLGISADRLRTVSYGKEFPFDPGHDDSAYAKNRRAHFVITAK